MAQQTIEQFGQTIKQKYPQYKDIPDAELGQKMITKYPQYKDMVAPGSPTPAKKGADVLGTTEKIVGNIFPGRQVGNAIGTLAGYGITAGKEALGMVPKGTTGQYDLKGPSPLQTVGDVTKGAALIGGLGATAPASILGNIAQGAGFGALSGAGQAATQTSGKFLPTGKDVGQIAKGAAIGGAVGGAISGATSAIGKLVERSGDKIINTAIKPTKADIADGFNIQTIKDNNLGGSLSTMYDKTEAQMNDLTQQLNQKLANSDATVDLNNVFDNTVKSMSGNKLKSFGSNTSVEKALQQLKGEITNVSEDGALSIPQAQLVKQASGKFGAWQYGIPDPESTARQAVYSSFYNQLKTAIEEGSPDGVKEINKQLSQLIPVQNAIIRRIPVAERNSALSLTDMMTLTASMFNPHALVGLGISLGQKEGVVGNILSKLGPKIGALAPTLGTVSGGGAASMLPTKPK